MRTFLMQRQMTSVWRSARDNIDMPEYPPDLSELQFAFLAFDLHFHVSKFKFLECLSS